MDAHFQAVARFESAQHRWSSREDHVARQKRHVRRNETDDLEAIENELARVRVLAQLPVLEKLDGQIMRVDLRFHVRPERRESVE